ncbi:hypothetical protein F4859DRAFT_485635 [Xylaria cf. heliscus]|nr:hypothetical protein F4859DRAFT_485635 [Xylaria cf. heliscus]
MGMPIRNQDDYPTISIANSSYYQLSSITPGFSPISLTTIVISRTATITLTTVALITSESTVTTVAPLSAPLLSSEPTKVTLSPSNIAGIVVGTIAGLLVFVLLFYLLLTRAKWLIRLSNYRLQRQEQEYRRKRPRRPKQAKRPAENATRNSRIERSTGDGRRTELKRTTNTRLSSMLVTSEERQREWNERYKAFEADVREVRKTRDDEHRIGNRR